MTSQKVEKQISQHITRYSPSLFVSANPLKILARLPHWLLLLWKVPSDWTHRTFISVIITWQCTQAIYLTIVWRCTLCFLCEFIANTAVTKHIQKWKQQVIYAAKNVHPISRHLFAHLLAYSENKFNLFTFRISISWKIWTQACVTSASDFTILSTKLILIMLLFVCVLSAHK